MKYLCTSSVGTGLVINSSLSFVPVRVSVTLKISASVSWSANGAGRKLTVGCNLGMKSSKIAGLVACSTGRVSASSFIKAAMLFRIANLHPWQDVVDRNDVDEQAKLPGRGRVSVDTLDNDFETGVAERSGDLVILS